MKKSLMLISLVFVLVGCRRNSEEHSPTNTLLDGGSLSSEVTLTPVNVTLNHLANVTSVPANSTYINQYLSQEMQIYNVSVSAWQITYMSQPGNQPLSAMTITAPSSMMGFSIADGKLVATLPLTIKQVFFGGPVTRNVMVNGTLTYNPMTGHALVGFVLPYSVYGEAVSYSLDIDRAAAPSTHPSTPW